MKIIKLFGITIQKSALLLLETTKILRTALTLLELYGETECSTTPIRSEKGVFSSYLSLFIGYLIKILDIFEFQQNFFIEDKKTNK